MSKTRPNYYYGDPRVVPWFPSVNSLVTKPCHLKPFGNELPVPSPTRSPANRDLPPPVLRFNEYGDFAALLNNSPHSVVYNNLVYPTALHLYEAHKFLDHKPEVAEQIRGSELRWVLAVSGQYANFMRRDWGNIGLRTMDEVLYLKFTQHRPLRVMLLNTYPADLVYVDPRDPFWGDGGNGIGMNELGKSLMRVRKQLREVGM